MNYTLREIRPDDIDRIQGSMPEYDALRRIYPDWVRYFHERMEDPESFDGYTAELESGEILGIGMAVFMPQTPAVGVMCVYATARFRRYPLAVVKAAREIVQLVIDRNRPRRLVAYAHRNEKGIARWMETFGFYPIPTPAGAPAELQDLDLYLKEVCCNG